MGNLELKVTGLQGKLVLVRSFCCRVAEVMKIFVMFDFVRQITAKNSCMVNMDHLSICSCLFFGYHFNRLQKWPASL